MTGEALANRVRAAAKAAGLGDGFSGHSGRIGMARRMVAAGAPTFVLSAALGRESGVPRTLFWIPPSDFR